MGRVVDLLLSMGADETIMNKEGLVPVDLVGQTPRNLRFVGAMDIERNVARVKYLLANAAVDRAWRRRGMLVMCRAFPDRMPPHRPSGRPGGQARGSSTPGACIAFVRRKRRQMWGTAAAGFARSDVDEGGLRASWGSVATQAWWSRSKTACSGRS